jgi:RNA polymerase sigma-70 factor (ECF subfamily)
MPADAPTDAIRAALPGHLAALWRYGLVLARDRATAEDLVQQTCLRALERAHQFEPGSRLDRWLFSILRSIWLNEVRARRYREGAGHDDAAEVLTVDGARVLETNMTAARVLTEVQGLPEAQRETVFLVYVQGLTYAEAAEALAIPIGTVMSRLAAARLRLARLRDDAVETGMGEPRNRDAR